MADRAMNRPELVRVESIPARWRPPTHRSFSGFTLLELIVVMAVIGTVLVLTLPRLSLPGIRNDLEAVARQLIDTHRRLRAAAAALQLHHTLHLDLDRQRIWISNAGMNPEQMAAAAAGGYDLPRRVSLERLHLPGGREIGSGTYGVEYFPEGNNYMVDLDLGENSGREMTLRIEPFLAESRMVEDDEKRFSL